MFGQILMCEAQQRGKGITRLKKTNLAHFWTKILTWYQCWGGGCQHSYLVLSQRAIPSSDHTHSGRHNRHQSEEKGYPFQIWKKRTSNCNCDNFGSALLLQGISCEIVSLRIHVCQALQNQTVAKSKKRLANWHEFALSDVKFTSFFQKNQGFFSYIISCFVRMTAGRSRQMKSSLVRTVVMKLKQRSSLSRVIPRRVRTPTEMKTPLKGGISTPEPNWHSRRTDQNEKALKWMAIRPLNSERPNANLCLIWMILEGRLGLRSWIPGGGAFHEVWGFPWAGPNFWFEVSIPLPFNSTCSWILYQKLDLSENTWLIKGKETCSERTFFMAPCPKPCQECSSREIVLKCHTWCGPKAMLMGKQVHHCDLLMFHALFFLVKVSFLSKVFILIKGLTHLSHPQRPPCII